MTNSATDKKAVTPVADTSNNDQPMPININLTRWEEAGYEWSGTITPAQLPRIVAIVPEAYRNHPIKLAIKLAMQAQLLTLQLAFEGEVWVTCQRCLHPLDSDVTHQTKLILLQSEAQEGLVEETQDYVLLEELLVEPPAGTKRTDRFLPLQRLVEDELLLDIPLSAKHDDCEMAVEQVGEIIEEEAENPFAALEALKGKL